MKPILLSAVALLFAAQPTLSQAPPQNQGAETGSAQPAEKMKKPMRMNEPMPTPMAKEGMMKGDVEKHAAEKQAEMNEMMKKEEEMK